MHCQRKCVPFECERCIKVASHYLATAAEASGHINQETAELAIERSKTCRTGFQVKKMIEVATKCQRLRRTPSGYISTIYYAAEEASSCLDFVPVKDTLLRLELHRDLLPHVVERLKKMKDAAVITSKGITSARKRTELTAHNKEYLEAALKKKRTRGTPLRDVVQEYQEAYIDVFDQSVFYVNSSNMVWHRSFAPDVVDEVRGLLAI